MSPKPTQDQLDSFEKISKHRSEKHFGWLRNIVAMATGLTGVIISLRSEKSTSLIEHYCFVSTIGLLALGVLLGAIALYAEVHLWSRIQKEYGTRLSQQEAGTYKGPAHFVTGPKPIFEIVEKASYVSLLLALVSLVVYAWISDFPTP